MINRIGIGTPSSHMRIYPIFPDRFCSISRRIMNRLSCSMLMNSVLHSFPMCSESEQLTCHQLAKDRHKRTAGGHNSSSPDSSRPASRQKTKHKHLFCPVIQLFKLRSQKCMAIQIQRLSYLAGHPSRLFDFTWSSTRPNF